MFHLALFENTLDFFVKGGVFMAVLLLCSFVALTVILLRSFALRRRAVIPVLIEKEINKIFSSWRLSLVFPLCSDCWAR
jgi:hypothetical protein